MASAGTWYICLADAAAIQNATGAQREARIFSEKEFASFRCAGTDEICRLLAANVAAAQGVAPAAQ